MINARRCTSLLTHQLYRSHDVSQTWEGPRQGQCRSGDSARSYSNGAVVSCPPSVCCIDTAGWICVEALDGMASLGYSNLAPNHSSSLPAFVSICLPVVLLPLRRCFAKPAFIFFVLLSSLVLELSFEMCLVCLVLVHAYVLYLNHSLTIHIYFLNQSLLNDPQEPLLHEQNHILKSFNHILPQTTCTLIPPNFTTKSILYCSSSPIL